MAAKISRQVERQADALFSKLGMHISFSVMDLNKIVAPVEALLANGGTEEAAHALMAAQIAKYRQN